jgi:hypothetical protein
VRAATTTPHPVASLPTLPGDFVLRVASCLALAALMLVLGAHPALLSTDSALPDRSAPHVIDTSNEQLPGGDADDSSPSGILQSGDVAEANGNKDLGEILQLAAQAEVSPLSSGNNSWSVQPVLAAAQVTVHIPLLQPLRGPPLQNS